jgi:putative heme-binding domain-containing protein
LRDAILVKNKLWFNRYRATDGYNVYGGRSRLAYVGTRDGVTYTNFEVLQRELDHIDGLCANRDEQVWAIAKGEEHEIDDSNVIPLLTVATNLSGAGEDGAHRYASALDAKDEIVAAPGMIVDVFADERQFPELVNPVQMAWDTRGRLWVATWQTYPHWQPDQEMNDKLLILEDTDGDGRANTCTVFADNLHNPTGIEFWNGGVLLGGAPDLLFLKDTDGDDRVDHTEVLLHGLSSADTHHGLNSFVIGQDGALYFQEGTFHQSQIESIYGPVRNQNGCVWRFDPRTWRVERYIPYNYANPHGHVFDRWGQDFMTDGTGNVNYYALPFSGFMPEPRKHSAYFPFFMQSSRPAGGTEILSSRHFPEENQGNYLIANVIGFRGIFQYKVKDDGSGFSADAVEPIVQSSDLNFRPVDIEMGPDGALYFLDWHNALIGHMQHHLRDPSRDAAHGRVFRVTYEGRELLKPEPIAGQSIEALLELLKSPEDRTRYRARIELSGHDSDLVAQAAIAWAAALDTSEPEFEHHRLEALWMLQQHNRLDRFLLLSILQSPEPRARAAATRVIRNSRHLIPDALTMLRLLAGDEDPRVRLEVVVATSFFRGADAADVALEVLKKPTDKFIDYALTETMIALEEDWQSALKAQELIAVDNPAGVKYLLTRVNPEDLINMPHVEGVLRTILTRAGVPAADRLTAATELSEKGGTLARTLLWAIHTVDIGTGPGADETILELGSLLRSATRTSEPAPRAGLVALAERGERRSTRSVGYAELVSQDGNLDAAWTSARQARDRVISFLDSVSLIEDPALRAGLASTLRLIMFPEPKDDVVYSPGTGVFTAVYEPAPSDAKLETFATLIPEAEQFGERINLDFAKGRNTDNYGLLFAGSLFVPSEGLYTLRTSSDDGSRLYIDGKSVVDNDGSHGTVSKSGQIQLTAGAHDILVTYFNSGGAESLSVHWSGPDFEDQEIPAASLGKVVGARSGTAIRHAASLAMAHLPTDSAQKLADAARLLETPNLLGASLAIIDSVPKEKRAAQSSSALVDALLLHIEKVPAELHTSESITRAIALGRELAAGLSPDEKANALARLDGLGGTSIVISTLPHQMLYDLGEFWVEAGKPVSITFRNNDMMPHNLVFTLPGELVSVGQAAEKLAPSSGSMQYIPESDSVLWHTGLVLPGETEVLTFTAPDETGERPFVCTYPGHWRVMNGVMHIVAAGSDKQAIERRESEATTAPIRRFIKDWKLEELLPILTADWESKGSRERGAQLFNDAGCIKCHSVTGTDACGGPDLMSVGEKYQGADLLAHIMKPSKEVLEDYKFYIFEVEGQKDVIGRILTEDGENLHIVPVLLEPENVVVVPKDKIIERFDTGISPMPTGMLVTLDEAEILDLLLFLQSAKEEGEKKSAAVNVPHSDSWVDFYGYEGPGLGKHIVLVSGDEEYRSEEALPMLARILATHHGFRCTVLFATDKETGEVNPNEQTNIPGMHLLDTADMLICFLRFRELPDQDMAHFAKYVESGKPILGLRTSTHAFDYKRDKESPYAKYGWASKEWPGGFGQQILGDTWINHHGHHGQESTRGVIEPANASHPILRGVDDVWGPTDVYGVRNIPSTATVLLLGQVLDGMQPSNVAVDGPKNNPMMPIAWARELPKANGQVQRIVCSTIGASVDCESTDLRRLFVNSCYWGLGMEDAISADSPVDTVGSYDPTPFGFGSFQVGKRASDF